MGPDADDIFVGLVEIAWIHGEAVVVHPIVSGCSDKDSSAVGKVFDRS